MQEDVKRKATSRSSARVLESQFAVFDSEGQGDRQSVSEHKGPVLPCQPEQMGGGRVVSP